MQTHTCYNNRKQLLATKSKPNSLIHADKRHETLQAVHVDNTLGHVKTMASLSGIYFDEVNAFPVRQSSAKDKENNAGIVVLQTRITNSVPAKWRSRFFQSFFDVIIAYYYHVVGRRRYFLRGSCYGLHFRLSFEVEELLEVYLWIILIYEIYIGHYVTMPCHGNDDKTIDTIIRCNASLHYRPM